jgi:phage shock protein PspC (stress-responsive transcriptional regulator)
MSSKQVRIEGALLAGVCAGIARTFNWNVWVLRALFIAFLLVKTLWAVVAYVALALIFNLRENHWPGRSGPKEGLASPELADRGERIAELERRFRELENS